MMFFPTLFYLIALLLLVILLTSEMCMPQKSDI
jgi:hypothetical protein